MSRRTFRSSKAIARYLTGLLRLALLVLVVTSSACATLSQGGSNVPDLPLEDTNGKRVYLSDVIGHKKAVVMTFWATWCMPCRSELAVLQDLYQKHRSEGLEILAISLDGPETMSRVRPFIKQNGYTFKVLIDRESRAVALYNPKRQAPMMHIFDANGRIAYSHGTYQPAQAPLLRKKILSILRRSSTADTPERKQDADDR